MSGIDYAILAIIAISALIGVWRGFVREALSLGVWIAAFWLAYMGAETMAVLLGKWIEDPGAAMIIAFVSLFLLVHIAGFILSRLLVKLVKSIGLGAVDRVAGAGFGFARGMVVVAAIILVVGMTPLTNEILWQESFMVAVFGDVIAWVQQYFPQGISDKLAQVVATASWQGEN